MIFPIRTDYRLRRTPWVNYALIAANVIIYFLGFNSGNPQGRANIFPWMLWPNHPEFMQFVTCTFLHAGFWHLFGNMIFLWVFGNAINAKFGHLGYLAFYLAGGILSGVGYLLLDASSPVLGASGAIAAVTGAYLVLLPGTRVTVIFWMFLIFPLEVSSLYFIALQVVFEWIMTGSGMVGFGGGGIAYAAHATGYLVGIATAFVLLGLGVLDRDDFDLLHLLRQFYRQRQFRRLAEKGQSGFFNPKSPPSSIRVQTVSVDSPSTPPTPEQELRSVIRNAYNRHDLPTAAAEYERLLHLDPNATLDQQQQLDIANQLMADQRHAGAAIAYERFVNHYADYNHIGDIYLLLGLLHGRYLQQADLARVWLEKAITHLSDTGKTAMARAELEELDNKE